MILIYMLKLGTFDIPNIPKHYMPYLLIRIAVLLVEDSELEDCLHF